MPISADRLPPAFLALHASGKLAGAPPDSLTDEQYHAHRTGTLLWSTLEWDMTLDEVLQFEADGEYMRPGLIPFAGDGHGDRFCFYPPWQEGAAEPPIVRWVHDQLESYLYARTFSEFLARQMLLEWLVAEELQEDEPEVMQEVYAAQKALVWPYLTEVDRARLTRAGEPPTLQRCDEEESALDDEIGNRELIGVIPPQRYDEAHFDRDTLVRAYTRDAEVLRELVEDEGYEALRARWQEAKANLARVSR